MTQHRIPARVLVVFLVLVCGVAASVGRRGGTVVNLRLGDSFTGRVAFPSQVDTLEFLALAGTKVNVNILGKGTLAPSVKITDLTTVQELGLVGKVKGLGKKAVNITQLVLPSTGSYQVGIGSANGQVGDYSVKTTGVKPVSAKTVKFSAVVAGGGSAIVDFDAIAGTLASATVTLGKGSLAIPSVNTINGPTSNLDVRPFVSVVGKKLLVKKAPLVEFGAHGLVVNNTGTTGTLMVTLTMLAPVVPKQKLAETPEAATPGSIGGQVAFQILDGIAESEPNDSILQDQFVGQLFPGKVLRILGNTTTSSGGDIDVFRFAVAESQALSLTLIHDVADDFDLVIPDPLTGLPSIAFATANEPEIGIVDIEFPGGGIAEFDVAVLPFAGAGDYQLTVVSAPAAAGGAAVGTGGGGLALTTLPRDPAAPASSRTPSPAHLDRVVDLDKRIVAGEFVVQLQDPRHSPTEWAARQGLTVRAASPGGAFVATIPGMTRERNADRKSRLDTLARARSVRSLADVDFAEPNFVREHTGILTSVPLHASTFFASSKVFANPNDPFLGLQWHYPLMNLPQTWDITQGSANVFIGILDTGITAHPDLAARDSGEGFDMISDAQNARDGNGIDNNPTDPGDLGGQGGKSTWHGTHVAGTIGASTNNGAGVSGVDWNCRLTHVRVLGKFGGDSFDISEGIKYAARLPNVSNKLPSHKVNIINMSLGGGGFSQNDQNVITQAKAAGVTIVAAAGNNNSPQAFFPASYDGVISVSAVDLQSNKAPYSNFNNKVDVAAPGGNSGADVNGDGFPDGVLSTLVNDSQAPFTFNFDFYQGTSMASPHVAGLCALILAVNPQSTPDQVETHLKNTATDLGTAGMDDIFGFGLVNALAAVQAAQGNPGTQPLISTSAVELNFGGVQTSLPLNITNLGGGSLTFTTTTPEATGGNWLTVNPTNGVAPQAVSVLVNRAGLPEGVYTGALDISSDGGSASVAVSMEVASGVGTNVPFTEYFVVAVDAFSLLEIAGLSSPAASANYAFLPNIPPGTYLVFAGIDLDNDGFICGPGEPCGIFPSFDVPYNVELTPGATIVGIDFPIVDQLVLPTAGATFGVKPFAPVKIKIVK